MPPHSSPSPQHHGSLPGLPGTAGTSAAAGDDAVGRLRWMDVLRGVAILLVIVNHAAAAVVSRGYAAPALISEVNTVLAPVRIPALVFLSGLLVAPSLARGRRRYLAGKARRLVYPYLLWTAVYLVVLVRPWSYGDPYGPAALLEMLVRSPSPLWFLSFLAAFYLLALVLRRVPAPLLIAASLGLSLLVDGSRAHRFLFLLGFFLIGVALTHYPQAWRAWLTGPRLAGLGLLTAALLLASLGRGEQVRYEAAYAPAVLAAVLLLARGAHAISDHAVAVPLRYLGVNSLPVYVVHYLAAFVLAELLQRAGVTSSAGAFAAVTVAAFVSGVLAVEAARRSPLVDLLFALPRRRPDAAVPTARH